MPTPRLTDEQLRETADTYLAEGRNQTKTAQSLGIGRSALQNRLRQATERGFLLPDADAEVPDGYKIKGTSTLYSTDPETGQRTKRSEWVKTDLDRERQKELAEAAIQALCADIPARKPTKAKGMFSDDLMACYPVGDHHFGMLAWAGDAAEDFDLKIAESLLCGAMDHLVSAAPKCEEAAVVLLGDFMHYDGMESVTNASGHQLDSDSRPAKMIDVAMGCFEYLIITALKHHKTVRVIIEPGNHDERSSLWMARSFAMLYRNEPRITVDTSARLFHYFKFGKCLVGTHHGHKVKLADLPLLMATDLPREWGETEHRYWWTGHVHHDQVKDFNGCRAESFRILPPADAYAYNAGYRSKSDMKAIILHKEHGEVARHTVNPAMLEVTK